ncbi:MAG TPA: ABC transporter permease [Candidatus Nanoarchaeia archaeon]|nr:ABC transporter permease [Candidatus Nanoarchaeia archaeon]
MVFNWIGTWTIIKREQVRTIKIINQVIWPPIISSLLYILIFGYAVGKNLHVGQVSYFAFLVPGLIMMNVIMSAYEETSSSVFHARYLNYIHELLMAPLSYWEMIIGYMVGSIIRSFVIGNLILAVFLLFIPLNMHSLLLYLFFILAVSVLFASIGLIVALWAERFDNLAVLNTFFITPLLFLGGVFTSLKLLPEIFQKASLFNPLFYMIDGFRYSMIGSSDINPLYSTLIITFLAIVFFIIAAILFKKGYKLKV